MKTEEVHLIYARPGRVRLKIALLKRNPAYAEEIQRRLWAIRGIHHVEANPLTGSVLALYDPTCLESVDFHLDIARALDITLSDLDPSHLATWQTYQSNGDQSATGVGCGLAEWRALVPLVLLLLGVRSLLFSDKLTAPVWYDYLWFAFGSFFMLSRDVSSPK